MKDLYVMDENMNIIRKSDKYSMSRLSYSTVNLRSSKVIGEVVEPEAKYIEEDMASVKSFRTNNSKSMNQFILDSKSKFKNLYVQKCICLASLYPFFMELGKILKTIYLFSKNSRVLKPLEKIIESLIIEVPAPPRGIWKVNLKR